LRVTTRMFETRIPLDSSLNLTTSALSTFALHVLYTKTLRAHILAAYRLFTCQRALQQSFGATRHRHARNIYTQKTTPAGTVTFASNAGRSVEEPFRRDRIVKSDRCRCRYAVSQIPPAVSNWGGQSYRPYCGCQSTATIFFQTRLLHSPITLITSRLGRLPSNSA
jgi:hypothetical protein